MTCSDVLAELNLPPSGISRQEDVTAAASIPFGEDMWLYYLLQASLRKILNGIHSDVYKIRKNRDHASASDELKFSKYYDTWLEQWRETLPPQIQWDDSDPPAKDINAARLRAKYYGAKYIIHRPFLNFYIHGLVNDPGRHHQNSDSPALSNAELTRDSPSSGAPATPAGSAGRRPSVNNTDVNAMSLGPNAIEAHCKKCLDAAVQSTSAFHAFDTLTNRPVLTNIFGTAHA